MTEILFYGFPSEPTEFTFTTADDEPEADPISFIVENCSSGNGCRFLGFNEVNAPEARRTDYPRFNLPSGTIYFMALVTFLPHYKLHFMPGIVFITNYVLCQTIIFLFFRIFQRKFFARSL